MGQLQGGGAKNRNILRTSFTYGLFFKGPFIYDVYTERGGQLAQIEDVVREVACI